MQGRAGAARILALVVTVVCFAPASGGALLVHLDPSLSLPTSDTLHTRSEAIAASRSHLPPALARCSTAHYVDMVGAPGGRDAHIVAHAAGFAPTGGSLVPWAEVPAAWRQHAHLAVALLDAHRSPIPPAWHIHSDPQSGSTASLAPRGLSADAAAHHALCLKFERDAEAMRSHFAAHPNQAVRDWGPSILPAMPAHLLPPEARGIFVAPSAASKWRLFHITHPRYDSPSTSAPRYPPPQPPGPPVSSMRELVGGAGPLDCMRGWCAREARSQLQVAAGKGRCNAAVALSAAGAGQLIYDTRGPPPYRPLSFGPVSCALRPDAIADVAGPDLELVAFARHGVLTKAELPPLAVLGPALLSLGEGMGDARADAAKHVRGGHLDQCPHPPFWPLIVNATGTVPKAGGGSRRITDGNTPHAELVVDGVRARSLNDAGDVNAVRPDGSRVNPRERKLNISELCDDADIIRYAASLMGEEPVAFSSDFAGYFRQFRMHPSEWWKLNFCIAEADGSLQFYTELSMPMGISISSNVAQRLATCAIRAALADIDKIEEPIWRAIERDPNTPRALLEWIAARRDLEARFGVPALRAMSAGCYTDDALWLVVGWARAARALIVWLETCARLGLLLADAAKQCAGQCLAFVGIVLLMHLGLVVIPPTKVSKALSVLHRLSSDAPPTYAELRSLDGLLNSFQCALRWPSSLMHAMYAEHGEHVGQPGARVTQSAAMVQAARRWIALLESMACAAFVAPSPEHAFSGGPIFHVFSDAAQEGAASGLGGFAAGTWWHASVVGMPPGVVAALELLAAGIQMLLSLRLFPSGDIVVGIDNVGAEAAWRGGPRARLMQSVHDWIYSHEEARAAAHRVRCVWLSTHSNAAADAASRQEDALIATLCRALRLPERRIEVQGVQAVADWIVARTLPLTRPAHESPVCPRISFVEARTQRPVPHISHLPPPTAAGPPPPVASPLPIAPNARPKSPPPPALSPFSPSLTPWGPAAKTLCAIRLPAERGRAQPRALNAVAEPATPVAAPTPYTQVPLGRAAAARVR